MGANLGCKTKLVRNHVLDIIDDRFITTLGTKVTKKVLSTRMPGTENPVTLDFTVWDIHSSRGFQELLKEAYFHGSRGILAVTDMTRRATLDDVHAWIGDVQSVAGRVPVVILAANRDQRERWEMTEEEVSQAARVLGAPCFFISGPADEGVEDAFRNLAETVLRRLRMTRQTPQADEERP